MWIIYIIIIYPPFFTCIIWWVNVNTINLPFIFRQQSLQGFKVISMNNLIATMCFRGIRRIIPTKPIFMLQHTEWYFRMMVNNLIFSYPM